MVDCFALSSSQRSIKIYSSRRYTALAPLRSCSRLLDACAGILLATVSGIGSTTTLSAPSSSLVAKESFVLDILLVVPWLSFLFFVVNFL